MMMVSIRKTKGILFDLCMLTQPSLDELYFIYYYMKRAIKTYKESYRTVVLLTPTNI